MTEIVKELLVEDTELKKELIKIIKEMLAKFLRRLTIVFIGLGLVFVAVLAANAIYFNETEKLFMEKIELITKKQDSARFDKEQAFRILDTNEHYVRPMYDTIK